MRLATGTVDSRLVFGPLGNEGLTDVSAHVASPIDLLGTARTAEGRAGLDALTIDCPTHALDQVTLMPPIPEPRRILCVGTNYADHVAESDTVTEAPPYPMIFTRFPSSLVGHGQPIIRPTVSTSFDYEGELAIVIGSTTRHAKGADALAAVAAYSCFMDGTLRDWQRHTSQFVPGKTFEQSGAWGPWLVTADEIEDPYNLQLTTRVDGKVMQQASTSQLIFNIEDIVSYCSTFTTLEMGDVIATGTPGGVGYKQDPPLWLTPGTTVEVEIDAVGTLANKVADEQI